MPLTWTDTLDDIDWHDLEALYREAPLGHKPAASSSPIEPRRGENGPAYATRSAPVAWILLVIAGLLEVGWAIGLKYTEGFTRPLAGALTLAAMAGSVVLLGIAMKSLPVGTSYAVWVGVGAVGTAILGIVLFGEPANAGRLASLALIVAGIVGLKLTTAT